MQVIIIYQMQLWSHIYLQIHTKYNESIMWIVLESSWSFEKYGFIFVFSMSMTKIKRSDLQLIATDGTPGATKKYTFSLYFVDLGNGKVDHPFHYDSASKSYPFYPFFILALH